MGSTAISRCLAEFRQKLLILSKIGKNICNVDKQNR